MILSTSTGGGEKLISHVQEFSLFSSLGVTEIAPWLSDENNQNDDHHTMDDKNVHSHLSINQSICPDESGDYEARMKHLEEVTRMLEQKVRNLELKQKDKENRTRSDNFFPSSSLSDLKDSRDTPHIGVNSNDNKDAKSGGVNIERFRTLEGRQAFQQSKFSSLDIVFGGSSSSVWSKGDMPRNFLPSACLLFIMEGVQCLLLHV